MSGWDCTQPNEAPALYAVLRDFLHHTVCIWAFIYTSYTKRFSVYTVWAKLCQQCCFWSSSSIVPIRYSDITILYMIFIKLCVFCLAYIVFRAKSLLHAYTENGRKSAMIISLMLNKTFFAHIWLYNIISNIVGEMPCVCNKLCITDLAHSCWLGMIMIALA